MVASLHREPKRVLVIGLSTGSWVRVLSMHQAVERMIVVEINPGYEQLIAEYPAHRRILEDPRITIVHDDGRRWLRRHAHERFDFIVMNTTWHYRSNVTNLLSREFLELCRGHLEPRGVLYYNTTGSPDAIFTAAATMSHVVRYASFVAASDAPIALSLQERRDNLRRFVLDGAPFLSEQFVERYAKQRLPELGREYRARADVVEITDDNMLTEFKRARGDIVIPKLYRWYDDKRAWMAALALR
jgi:spermidine synthase